MSGENKNTVKGDGLPFDELVARFGVRRDVAAGLRVACRLARDGKISEEKFLKNLRELTSRKAQ